MPLSFRQLGSTFIAGPNIGIYPSGNSFAISGSAPSIGGLTGITTIGSGTFSIASSVTNNNLVYRSLSGTSNFSIIEATNGTLTFTASTLATIISGVNASTGVGVFCGTTTINNANDTLSFYTLSTSGNTSISLKSNDEIVIDRGQVVVNTISNQGDGARILSAITGNSLVQRTITGFTSGFTAALVNNASVTGETSAITANTLVNITPTNTTADRFYITTTGPILTASTNILPTAVTGNMGIGITPVTTSRLLLPSGTAAVSQIRLTPFSAEPTNPSDGSIWYSTSGNTLKFEKDTIATDFIFKDNNLAFSGASNILVVNTGGTISPSYINSFGKFSSLSSRTLTDPTSETSIITSILSGTTTLLSSTNQYTPELVSGKKYRFNAKGTLVSNDLINLTLKIKLGSTIIGLVNNYTLSDTINGYFEVDYTFTIRSTGASGRVFGSGKILSESPLNPISLDSYIVGVYTNTTTIDTTSNQIFDCMVENDGAGMTMTITESSLEFLT